MTDNGPSLEDVLERAADLQRLVPGAVLVGGSAAAFHARHRRSLHHDHVLTDPVDRFDTILEHLEAVGDWSMNRAQPGKIILGELGGIETGLRQLFRQRPLETEQVEVRGKELTVPTAPETLRIKAWLALTRNQARDYVDIAALTEHLGVTEAAKTLIGMDDYYGDLNHGEEAVTTQLLRQLADPRPRDAKVTKELASYKGLDGARRPVARLESDHIRPPSTLPGDPAMKFRNVDVDPTRPLDEWPAEAIETLIDRGTRSDWKHLVASIRTNPWGPAARTAETVARWGEHQGVDVLVLDAVADARLCWDDQARHRYANRIRSWRIEAGLTQRQLAELVGTSASRLSAYENARVAPTTVVLGRIEQAVSVQTWSETEQRLRNELRVR